MTTTMSCTCTTWSLQDPGRCRGSAVSAQIREIGLLLKSKDFLSGAFFMLVSALVIYVAAGYPFGSARRLGPGVFPMALAFIMMALGAILVGRAVLASGREQIERLPLRPVILILVGSTLFGLLIRPAGLLIAIICMVLVGALASHEIKPGQAAITALILAIGSWFVFTYLLAQPLPVFGYWFG